MYEEQIDEECEQQTGYLPPSGTLSHQGGALLSPPYSTYPEEPTHNVYNT